VIIRRLKEVKSVEWGNGQSRRFLLAADGMGYTLTDTIVKAGTKSRIQYRQHLEACYCIEGTGAVAEADGTMHPIEPGTLYALDRHDMHFLIADPHNDVRLVCVFSPPLQGDERHIFRADEFSQY